MNQNVKIDSTLCMCRKNLKDGIHLQCSNKKKKGDYCGIHSKCKQIFRIDQELEKKNIIKNNNKYFLNKINISKYTKKKELIEYAFEQNIKIPDLNQLKKNDIYKIICEFNNITNFYKPHINKIILIQSLFRSNLVRKIIKLRGEGFLNKKEINNEEDFYTMEKKSDIDNLYFFSYKDIDKFVYFFDIRSFQKLIENTKINPYTRNNISQKTIDDFNDLNRLLKKFFNYEDFNKPVLNKKQDFRQKVLEIFSIFDELDFYTDFNWFMKLNLNQLKHFYKAAEDIWAYRANLPYDSKKRIRPDLMAFTKSVNDIFNIYDKNELQEIILNEIKNFITKGLTKSDKVLGGMYMLTALTEVSHECATALPWLLQYN